MQEALLFFLVHNYQLTYALKREFDRTNVRPCEREWSYLFPSSRKAMQGTMKDLFPFAHLTP